MGTEQKAAILSQGLSERASAMLSNVATIIDSAVAAIEKEQENFGQLAPGTSAAGVAQVAAFRQSLLDHSRVIAGEMVKLDPSADPALFAGALPALSAGALPQLPPV